MVTRALTKPIYVCATQVEEINKPARALYESVGYVEVFRNEASSALRVQPGSGKDELLRYETATLMLMGKGVA